MSPQLRKSPPNESRHRGKSIASFEDHVDYADPTIRPFLLELRARIKSFDGGKGKIKEKMTKHQRVAYRVAQIFAEVKVQKKRILVRSGHRSCHSEVRRHLCDYASVVANV